MDPEEKRMLERSLRLGEENNRILKKMDRRARLSFIWGIIKIALIIVPLIIGYLYLEPYLDGAIENYQSIRSLF